MNRRQVSRDDVLDVLDFSRKMENYFADLLNDQELPIGMMALANAIGRLIVAQCDDEKEFDFWIKLFNKVINRHAKDRKFAPTEFSLDEDEFYEL